MRTVRIIDRYVFIEALGLFVLGFCGFLAFLLVNKLFLEVKEMFDPRISPWAVVQVVLLEGPAYMTWSLPVAILFATLMSMGRLAKDNELTAMFTNGISLYRLFIPFLVLSSLSVTIAYLTNEFLVTRAAAAQQRIYDKFPAMKGLTYENDPFMAKLENGQFVTAFYFDKLQGRLTNVVYDNWDTLDGRRLITAQEAMVRDNVLSLGRDQRTPATAYTQAPGSELYTGAVREPSTPVNLGLDLRSHFTELKTPAELTQADLARQSQQRRKLGENVSRDETDFHLRFSGPFASLAFALVAMPLSLRAPRDERLLGLILCFVLTLVYYFLFFMGKIMGYNEVLPPWLGAWGMNIVFAFLSMCIFIYSRK